MTWIRVPSRQTLLAILVTSPLLLSMAWLLGSIVVGWVPPRPLDGTPVELRREPIILDLVSQAPLKPAEMTIDFQRFNPTERRIDAGFNLTVTDTIREALFDGELKTPVWTRNPGSNALVLKPCYEDYKLRLVVRDRTNHMAQFRFIPLAKLFELEPYTGHANEVFAEQIVLALTGQIASYPNDWYRLDVLVHIELPVPLILRTGNHYMPLLPLDLSVGLSSEPEGRQYHAAHGTKQDSQIRSLSVLVTRDRPTIVFAYLLGMVPVVFALILGHMLFFHPESGEVRSDRLLVDAAAALLAILPLRQVLVPSEITVLTRVDALLALGIVMVISLVLAKYVTQLDPRRPCGPVTPPTGHQTVR